jgi:prephenate dehydratase
MAARKIAENGYRDALAIASEPALVKYGLDVLERDICKNNRTRFVVLGKDPVERTGNDRTFLAVHPLIKDKAGTLFDSLGFFAKREINLSAQMSRPDGNGGYWFYLEADGHISDPNMVDAVSGLKKYLNPEHKHEEVVKVLGGCRNTNWKDED